MIMNTKKPFKKSYSSSSSHSRRKSFIKRRRCFLTKHRLTYIDYKDVQLLKRFLSKSGQILPRFVTGTRAIYQRQIALAVKRARFLGLIGFVSLE